jgi:hypothetical protein
MDNAAAEYSFITAFFASELESPTVSSPREDTSSFLSPSALLSPIKDGFVERLSNAGSDFGEHMAADNATEETGSDSRRIAKKEEQAFFDTTWKQVLDPVLEYCQVWMNRACSTLPILTEFQAFVRSILDPIPPVAPLLTMIRLMKDIITEVQKRHCPPLESFLFGLLLQMWPIFQKAMSENIEVVKKLAEGAGGGYFSRSTPSTDATVSIVSPKKRNDLNSIETIICI